MDLQKALEEAIVRTDSQPPTIIVYSNKPIENRQLLFPEGWRIHNFHRRVCPKVCETKEPCISWEPSGRLKGPREGSEKG